MKRAETRIFRIEARLRRLRARSRGSAMVYHPTTGERRRRLVELHLVAMLGRKPSADEIGAALAAGAVGAIMRAAPTNLEALGSVLDARGADAQGRRARMVAAAIRSGVTR